ncbi:unnamed protein product [Closterium sp. NIES-54]
MAATKRVLRYLCSTSGMGLVLGGRRPVVLTGYADASWADDQATQRSSHGYTFSLGSGSVSWRSTRSSCVLSSSCEAEFYTGAMAAQELRWLTYLLTDLGETPRSPPVLYVDNKAMLALCREHRLEHRTKHIALRYFLARELQQRGQLRLTYVASEANTADIFTKALPPGDHQRLCTMLGFPTSSASKLDLSPSSSAVSSIATVVTANQNHHRLPELRSGVAFAHPSPQLRRLAFSYACPRRNSRQSCIAATSSSSSPSSSQSPAFPGMSAADSQPLATVPERAVRFTVTNGDGSKLSAFLVEPNAALSDAPIPDGAIRESANAGDPGVADGSAKVVIICHGFRSTKLSSTVQKLSDAILAAGLATVRFDFSGNGESEGVFATGNYRHEAADLQSVVEWVRAQGRHVEAVIGHSKGGNCVVLYASLYKDMPKVINVSGRYDLSRGIRERFGEEGMAKLEKEGQLTQQDKYGSYIITKESIQERLATDMAAAARAIPPSCSVCTIHGSEDATVPVEDASSFHADVPNHHLHIIDGACHNFRVHGRELGQAAVAFLLNKHL